MDYRLLLKKYIEHVRQSEGIDFIDRVNNRTDSDVMFSLEEEVELKILNGSITEKDITPIDLGHFGCDGKYRK